MTTLAEQVVGRAKKYVAPAITGLSDLPRSTELRPSRRAADVHQWLQLAASGSRDGASWPPPAGPGDSCQLQFCPIHAPVGIRSVQYESQSGRPSSVSDVRYRGQVQQRKWSRPRRW